MIMIDEGLNPNHKAMAKELLDRLIFHVHKSEQYSYHFERELRDIMNKMIVLSNAELARIADEMSPSIPQKEGNDTVIFRRHCPFSDTDVTQVWDAETSELFCCPPGSKWSDKPKIATELLNEHTMKKQALNAVKAMAIPPDVLDIPAGALEHLAAEQEHQTAMQAMNEHMRAVMDAAKLASPPIYLSAEQVEAADDPSILNHPKCSGTTEKVLFVDKQLDDAGVASAIDSFYEGRQIAGMEELNEQSKNALDALRYSACPPAIVMSKEQVEAEGIKVMRDSHSFVNSQLSQREMAELNTEAFEASIQDAFLAGYNAPDESIFATGPESVSDHPTVNAQHLNEFINNPVCTIEIKRDPVLGTIDSVRYIPSPDVDVYTDMDDASEDVLAAVRPSDAGKTFSKMDLLGQRGPSDVGRGLVTEEPENLIACDSLTNAFGKKWGDDT